MKTAKIELMILFSEFKPRLYSYVHCIVLKKKNVLVIVWTHLLCCSNILVLQKLLEKHSLFEYSGWQM